MARGWESKSVEQQQEERAEPARAARPPLSSDEQKRNRKRDGLVLSRERVTRELQTTGNAGRRQMLQQAIAELDSQLSALRQVTDSKSPK
jgi:hypothetical protein